MKLPVISATDSNTDIGDMIEKADCGYKVISGDMDGIKQAIFRLITNDAKFAEMQENAWNLLKSEFNSERSYKLIAEKLLNRKI